MDNIIQIKREHCQKLCGEKTVFHGLIKNYSGKSQNLKPQGSPHVLLLLCFLFKSRSPKLFSKVAVLIFCKISFETPAVDFCFSCRA